MPGAAAALAYTHSDALQGMVAKLGDGVTAFGAAFLAGLACGVWESVDDIALLRQSDRIFKPEMDAEQAKQYHDNWLRAVGRAEKWSQE